MILDWEERIIAVCEKLGIDPDRYMEDDEFKEWIARHFGFKDFDTFLALPSAKDIISEMALDMLPEHKNYQYHLTVDCIFLIIHNHELYNDQERTQKEVVNFLRYIGQNFSLEGKVLCFQNLVNIDNEGVKKLLYNIDEFNEYIESKRKLIDMVN